MRAEHKMEPVFRARAVPATAGQRKGEDMGLPASPTRASDAFRVWLRFLRLDQRLRLMMGRALRAIGLSVPQFDVLSALSQGAGMTQRELAQKLFVTKGNVSGLIDRMVDAGLVERRRGATDRRSHSLVLTNQGKEITAAGFAVQKSLVDNSLGRLAARDLASLHLLLGLWRDAAHQSEGPAGTNEANSRAAQRRASPKARKGRD